MCLVTPNCALLDDKLFNRFLALRRSAAIKKASSSVSLLVASPWFPFPFGLSLVTNTTVPWESSISKSTATKGDMLFSENFPFPFGLALPQITQEPVSADALYTNTNTNNTINNNNDSNVLHVELQPTSNPTVVVTTPTPASPVDWGMIGFSWDRAGNHI
jgi:hypothetical protein